MKANLISILCGFIGAALFNLMNLGRSLPIAPTSSTNQLNQSNQTDQVRSEGILSVTRLNLMDSEGRLRAQLGFAQEGPPGLWFMDEKGTARIAMGLYPDGTSHIGLQDQDGQMIQLMRSFGSQESPILIFKHHGVESMITGLNQTDNLPFFITYDKERRSKMIFGNYDGP